MRKTVLITGASSGIGEACARVFAKQSWRVLLLGRNEPALQKICSELTGDDHAYLPADISQSSSEKQIKSFLKHNNVTKLDLLINNAGINHIGLLGQIDLKHANAVFATNVLAVIRVTQTVLPLLILAEGQVINVSSIVGVAGIPNRSIYSASKAALEALSQAWRVELSPYNIAVSVIRPAGVSTNFHFRTPTDGEASRSNISVRTPEQIANEILRLSHTRRRVSVPGLRNAFYQWIARHLPGVFEKGMQYRLQREK